MKLKDEKLREVIEAYKVAISNVQYEGSLVWSRFGVLAGANTIVAGALGVIVNNSGFTSGNFNVVLPISLVGLLVSLMWFHVTARGFATITFWTLTSREIEDTLPRNIFNLYRRGSDFKDNENVLFKIDGKNKTFIRPWYVRNRLRTDKAAILIILVFIAVYAMLLIFSLKNLKSTNRRENIHINHLEKPNDLKRLRVLINLGEVKLQ